MINTTLCYITRGNDVLMLHRVKKKNDMNHDKWIGIGGKFEKDESPDDCLLREAREETGLTLTSWRCRGVVTFLSAKKLTVISDTDMVWTLDGERHDGGRKIEAQNHQHALRLVTKG